MAAPNCRSGTRRVVRVIGHYPCLRNAPGTQGYAEIAAHAVQSWERIPFADEHRHVLGLIPKRECFVLDIGAGTGRGAAWFADRGDRVVAVEPVDELRDAARNLHPSSRIEWIDDSLPHLSATVERGERFDLVILTAVWMHLDEPEQIAAMKVLASLLAPEGSLIMSLRHGAVPDGRRMFEVEAAATIRVAAGSSLDCVVNVEAESTQAANRGGGVTWTWLGFQRTPAQL